ncbi:uncharacterized protein LOC132546250 [Ylistrum balloti]|uniref:uncharacterized protein LOC132546250 n=1 Tax=Ylistrum balloti TaxID=509963 RepID=UPI00290584A6|nr:uncharacterized protein LOC132546250 [Ylistrum balloti]
MPYNSSDSHRSIDPDAVHQNGSGLNDTTNRLQPSYTSPSHISVTGVYHTSQTKTLDSDQVQGVISSTLSDVVKHNTDGSIFTNGMVSTSLDYPSSQKEANHNGKDMLNQNKDDFDIDSDVNQTNIEKPGQNPDVEEADMSETVLMSSSIAAVFLLNMVCIVLLITNRRRRKRKREEKARQEANERSTVSEYEVYQLACPYVTLPSAPYITITSGPYVCTSTISELESDKSKTENMTSSSGAESGYSTLPDTSTESVIDSQGSVYDDCLHIPRPHVKKDINKILDDAEVTSSVATTFPAKSRKRSSTMTYTSAKDSDIKYWFCEIPRPIVSFSKLKLKNNVTWGTWPKLESNPYVDSEASTTGNHTYEEILPSIQSDTSV